MNKKPYIAPSIELEPLETEDMIAATGGNQQQTTPTIEYTGDDNGNGIAESNRTSLFDDTLD